MKSLVKTYATKEGADYFNVTREQLIDTKVNFQEMIGHVGPFVETLLSACAVFMPSSKVMMVLEIARTVKVNPFPGTIIGLGT